jgi:Mg/Co/Ni transporter MgtE
MTKDDQEDKMRIYCAAAAMYAKAHNVMLSNVNFDDICKFMDSLDEAGAEELGELANEFEYRDEAVWFGDKRVMWVLTTH